MKKTLAFFLAICTIFTLVGCNSAPKASSVSIDNLMDAIKEFGNDVKSDTSDTADGYVVTVDCGNFMKVKAITDKKQHIISVDIIQGSANTDYYKTFTMEDVALDIVNWQDVPMGKVLCSFLVFRTASHIIPALTGKDATVDFVLSTRSSAQKMGKWEFSSSNSSDDVVISATYIG